MTREELQDRALIAQIERLVDAMACTCCESQFQPLLKLLREQLSCDELTGYLTITAGERMRDCPEEDGFGNHYQAFTLDVTKEQLKAGAKTFFAIRRHVTQWVW